METFWKTIGLYNSSTWIYQLAIVVVGIVLTIGLIRRQGHWCVVGMKLFLIALYLWIAVVYFYIYCAERSYNNVMALFWVTLAVAWLWDLLTGYTPFKLNREHTKLAGFLLFMPFLYPVTSLLRGMSFPEIVSPVMPCSVVVFTIGILLMFSRKTNLFIVLLLCHWSMIGLSKTFFFNIPEDYLLASTSVPAVYLFFKEYFLRDLHDVTKPQAKYMNWLLIAICVGIGAVLVGTMFVELAKDV